MYIINIEHIIIIYCYRLETRSFLTFDNMLHTTIRYHLSVIKMYNRILKD